MFRDGFRVIYARETSEAAETVSMAVESKEDNEQVRPRRADASSTSVRRIALLARGNEHSRVNFASSARRNDD